MALSPRTLTGTMLVGDLRDVQVLVGGAGYRFRVPPGRGAAPGEKVRPYVDPGHVVILPDRGAGREEGRKPA